MIKAKSCEYDVHQFALLYTPGQSVYFAGSIALEKTHVKVLIETVHDNRQAFFTENYRRHSAP